MPRHLPVVPAQSAGREIEAHAVSRPPWRWAAIGALGAIVLWAPLAMLASSIGAAGLRSLFAGAPPDDLPRWLASASLGSRVRFWSLLVALPSFAFVVASFASGVLVGRFASERVGLRAAGAGGLAAAWFGWGLMVARGASPAGAVAALIGTTIIGLGGALLGAVLGRRLRRVAQSPPAPTPSKRRHKLGGISSGRH